MSEKRRAVITGLGAVASLGTEIPALWQNLLQKKSGIGLISKFNASDYTCQIAGEVKNFDPTGIIDAKDLRRLDLFSQYALVAASNALKDANFELAKEDMTRFGVILGSGMGGMTEVEAQQIVIREKGPRRVSPFFIPKVMINAISAEVSIRYGFQGVNFVTSSACSSSGHAIGQALRTIQYGDADVIVTGGSEAIITPLSIAGFCSIRAMSQRNDAPEKASRPFDKDRDGFVMGEGSGILILEEYEHAKKRGAKIYAELRGYGANGDAFHITAPSATGEGAMRVMKLALQDGCVNPEEIQYINAHGTSTLPNDKIETLAIKKLFESHSYKIPISSTKSMLGHLLGAAGAIEAVVTALTVSNNQIHATANYETKDPECDLDYVGGDAREVVVKYALSNSFGFGGHNVCLLFAKLQ